MVGARLGSNSLTSGTPPLSLMGQFLHTLSLGPKGALNVPWMGIRWFCMYKKDALVMQRHYNHHCLVPAGTQAGNGGPGPPLPSVRASAACSAASAYPLPWGHLSVWMCPAPDAGLTLSLAV